MSALVMIILIVLVSVAGGIWTRAHFLREARWREEERLAKLAGPLLAPDDQEWREELRRRMQMQADLRIAAMVLNPRSAVIITNVTG